MKRRIRRAIEAVKSLRDPRARRALLETMRSREFLFEAALVTAAFGLTSAIAFFVSTRAIVKSVDSIVLEDLTGKSAPDAAIWLAGHGLRAEIAHFEDNDRAAPLTVVFHEPPAGEELREGLVVRLVISRGARSAPLPDVRGIYASQAKLILERNGLVAGDALEIHDASARGTVLASSPPPNSAMRGGATVRLLVSKGPKPRVWITPQIAWSHYETAEEIAAAMGVPLEIGSRMHTDEEPDGIVLEQFPSKGSRIVEGGSAIRLTVNGDIGRPAATGGATIVTLTIEVPRGFTMHRLHVRVIRAGWVRTLYDDRVWPGESVRVPAAMLPGDRAVATLDGRDVLVKTF